MKSMKMILGGLCAALGALALSSEPAEATCSSKSFAATICWTAATFCPQSFFVASGTLVSIGEYGKLYSLIGTTYGGDGINTFALPDLRGRAMAGAGTGPGLSRVTRGEQYGEEDVTMSTDNLPKHSHSVSMEIPYSADIKASTEIGDLASPEQAYPAARPSAGPPPLRARLYNNTTPADTNMASDIAVATAHPETIRTEPFGSVANPPVEIGLRPPQSPLVPCISWDGTYPPRS